MSNEALAAKVRAVNTANAYANMLFVKLKKFFTPYVGKEILLNDGGLRASIKKDFELLPNTVGISVYKQSSNYSLAYTVKTCEMIKGGHSCIYHETTVYIGKVDGKVLESLEASFEAKCDYTAADVEAKRAALREAQAAVSAASSALYPFGEYDR